MYTNITFILYSIAMAVSLICLVFIGLVFVHKNDRSNKTFLAIRNFAIAVMLTDVLYFIFYYREIVLSQYELILPFRIIDYILCISIYFFWILVLGNYIDKTKHRIVIPLGIIVCFFRLTISLTVTSLFMGAYYEIQNEIICKVWTLTEIAFVFSIVVIIIYCVICILSEGESKLHKKYVVICSPLLIVISVLHGVVDTGLFMGKYGASVWSMEMPDSTGGLLFLINLVTCIFVYKEDFSPLFLDGRGQYHVEAGLSLHTTMDIIAASHKLTVREREVLELIYEGYTNPEIGEQLFIAVTTVKKHTHNIFEKLDVSSRMEVVHLINAWKDKSN